MNATRAFLTAAALASAAPAWAQTTEAPAAPKAQLSESKVKLFENLKFSGYVQGRYVWNEASTQENPKDGFTVRRGRLKAQYELDWSEYLLQIDATPKGMALKDAEAALIEPWTGYKLRAILGQTKWPFGYEIGLSSSKREFPERAQVIRAFAPGERDRGAKFVGNIGVLRLMGGVFDGNGTDYKDYEGIDNDRYKDVIGRVGFDLKWISGGVSGWYGNTLRHEADGTPEATFPRTRLGADLQLNGTLLPIGATQLRLEGIRGRTYTRSGVEQFDLPAGGWYAVLTQRLGEKTGVAFRYDYFDGLLGTEDKVSSSDPLKAASTNSVTNLGVAVMYDWSKHLELTAAYEVPMTGGPVDPKDSMFTLQAQAMF